MSKEATWDPKRDSCGSCGKQGDRPDWAQHLCRFVRYEKHVAFREFVGLIQDQLDDHIRKKFFNNRHVLNCCEDVRQEALIRIYKNASQGRYICSRNPWPWILRIANNAAIDEIRKSKRIKRLLMAAQSESQLHNVPNRIGESTTANEIPDAAASQPSDIAFEKELDIRLQEAIQGLSSADKEIMALCKDMTFAEMAATLKISTSTAYQRVTRIYNYISGLLGLHD
jgi:RNA polymerase sigma factor (sigma-70 family)